MKTTPIADTDIGRKALLLHLAVIARGRHVSRVVVERAWYELFRDDGDLGRVLELLERDGALTPCRSYDVYPMSPRAPMLPDEVST